MRMSALARLCVLFSAAVQTKAEDTGGAPAPAPTTMPSEDSTPPPPMPCSSWGCPDGWQAIPGAMCASSMCTNDDLVTCCVQGQPTPAPGPAPSPTTIPFSAAPCSSWTCPDGYSTKDGQHFCAGEVCNNGDLATCCVLDVPVSTVPFSTVPTTTTPCSSTQPTTKKNWLPLAMALLPLVDQLRPAESTMTPPPTVKTTVATTQGAQTPPPTVVTTTEGSSGSSSGDNTSSDLWWLWVLLGLCLLCCCLGLCGSSLAAVLGMMGGKKKKKSRSTHRAPEPAVEQYVNIEQEPLLTVPPLMPPAPQPTMVETVQMVPQPTMMETTTMVPAVVETGVPAATSSYMTNLGMLAPTVPLSGGMMGSSMPASVSYGGALPGTPSYSVGRTIPGGIV